MKTKVLLLALLAQFFVLSANAYDALIDGIYYNFSGNEATVTYRDNYSYNSYSGTVVIPESVCYNDKTYSVTSIGVYAFYGCTSLTSITIPNSVTSIGGAAFSSSGLTSVHISDLAAWVNIYFSDSNSNPLYYAHHLYLNGSEVTELVIPGDITSIGKYAFYGCSGLTSVTIPNSVTSIGDYAFYKCSGLTTATISESVTSIGGSAFSNCSNLTTVTLESDAIVSASRTYNSSMKYIFGSQVKSYIIGDAVKSIGKYAFYECSNLTSVTIGSGVSSIGEYAFFSCSGLTSITIPECVTNIGSKAFYGCSGLTSVTIPNSVTRIGGSAFSNCSSLTSVTISESVTSIPGYAFSGCSGLTSVTIPNSVTSILNYAFQNCSGLTSVTIPESVTSIENHAFGDCSNLTTVTLESDAIVSVSRTYNYDSMTYMFGNQVKSYIIGDAVKSIGKKAFKECSNLTSVTIGSGVTSIGESAFSGLSGLTTVTIGSGVTTIGGYAFQSCSGLTSVTIPESVTTISNSAFSGCSGLTSITIPESVTSISNYAFNECSGLTSVTIPESVTSIGDHAFYKCSSLTSVTIPNSVTSIGGSAFSGCRSLTSVTIPESVTSIGYGAFATCNNLSSVTLESDAIVSASRTSDTSMKSIFGSQVNTYIIGDAVNSIGVDAFYGCSNLTSVTIGSGVTSIGDYAFDSCSGLTSVTLPNSVTSIGRSAFSSSGLTSVHITDLTAWLNIYFQNSSCNPLYNAHHLYLNGSEVTELIIPSDITSIGDYAFYGCSGLTSVNIGSSVTSIGKQSFNQCPISIVKVGSTSPIEIYSGTFSNSSNAILSVPLGSKATYQTANYWRQFKKIIEDGDVNADEEIDVVDVVDIARFAVGTPAETFIEFFADINTDGTVNIGDAVTLVNIIVGDENFVKGWTDPNEYTSSDVLGLTGRNGNLSLNLENKNSYTAFQFDLYVDESVEVSNIMLNAMRKQAHQLLYNKMANGHYRVVALSTSNHSFKGNDGELLNIALNGMSGEEVSIRNIHFFDADGNDYLFEDIESAVATSLSSPTTDPSLYGEEIYDLQGRKQGKLQRGINIVNGKKLLVK